VVWRGREGGALPSTAIMQVCDPSMFSFGAVVMVSEREREILERGLFRSGRLKKAL
jgi:hypothetical protein